MKNQMNILNQLTHASFETPIPALAGFLKRSALVLSVAALCATSAYAQHTDAETKVDAERHRAMAVAHETAAKCLESGKGEKLCMAELLKACKGLAIGKYCGMKHAH